MNADLRIYPDPNECGLAWSFRHNAAERGDDMTGAYGPPCDDNEQATNALRDLWRDVLETHGDPALRALRASFDYNDGACMTVLGEEGHVRAWAKGLGIEV